MSQSPIISPSQLSNSNASQRSTRSRRGRPPGKNSSTKNKIAVMDGSGQTDVERRNLRRSYRLLQREIKQDSDAITDVTSDKFTSIRNDNNTLWNQVRYTREAVLDSDNLGLIAASASRQIDKLIEIPRYDAVRFCERLKLKVGCGNDDEGKSTLDWTKLGSEVGVCFNAIPTNVTFLSGPLNAVPRERVRKQRKLRKAEREGSEEEDPEEEEPEEVKKHDKNNPSDQLSLIERNIKTVYEVLHKRTADAARTYKHEVEEGTTEDSPEKRARVGEMNAIRYLFNPKSFTQTVENVFHFSFLIKNGQAGIYKSAEGNPMVKAMKHENFPPPKQAIISFNMESWRQLNETYNNVDKGYIPNRSCATNNENNNAGRAAATPARGRKSTSSSQATML